MRMKNFAFPPDCHPDRSCRFGGGVEGPAFSPPPSLRYTGQMFSTERSEGSAFQSLARRLIPRAQKLSARNDNFDYVNGEAGTVEIESPWTARRREKMGLPLRVRKVQIKAR